jgi:hypothetical protein
VFPKLNMLPLSDVNGGKDPIQLGLLQSSTLGSYNRPNTTETFPPFKVHDRNKFGFQNTV